MNSRHIDNLEIPIEMYDFAKVLARSASSGKYPPNNWLQYDGKKCDHKSMHDSMFHHLAESYSGVTKDRESGLHPLLHLACRALMMYTRYENQLVHPLDMKSLTESKE